MPIASLQDKMAAGHGPRNFAARVPHSIFHCCSSKSLFFVSQVGVSPQQPLPEWVHGEPAEFTSGASRGNAASL